MTCKIELFEIELFDHLTVFKQMTHVWNQITYNGWYAIKPKSTKPFNHPIRRAENILTASSADS